MPSKSEFFERVWETELRALDYHEIRLRTEHRNDIDFNEVDTTNKVTEHYETPAPIFAAAMDSISDDKMAIAMGMVGGGAFIHHANTPDEQKKMVRSVKRHLNGRIDDPTTARIDDGCRDVLEMLDSKDSDYRTLPVIDENGKFSGLVTGNHFELFRPTLSESKIEDIMTPAETVPVLDVGSSEESIHDKHTRALNMMRQEKVKILPVLNEDRTVHSMYIAPDLLRVMYGNPDDYSLDDSGRLLTFASVPADPTLALERLDHFGKYLDVVAIDTSHGEHERSFSTLSAIKNYVNAVKEVRESYSHIDVVAGNISTAETATLLARAEPNSIKVGQGPGAICDSSGRLGFGTPQAQAVYECSEAINKVNKDMPIIADGGIKDSADTVKALALGASAVMVGGLVAGTEEQPVPEEKLADGTVVKRYWGMGSERAQKNYAAARQRYGNFDKGQTDIIFSEGHEVTVRLKGPVASVIKEHMLGVKISIGSQGFRNIAELQDGVSLMRGA